MRAQQIVFQTVANQENAFHFVTPRPSADLSPGFGSSSFFGPSLYPSSSALRRHLPISTVLLPVAAWCTYRFRERAKVKDFMSDCLESNRTFEMKPAIAATVAGVAAIMSSPSVMVARAPTWVSTMSWNAARTARNALSPTTREIEKSLVELPNNLNDVNSEPTQTSNSSSVPDGPCKACCGPIRVVEKSQGLDPRH
ncbi:hypothetical protein FRC04_001424 [Tulasnella sp. 424]|nr:hypothetical protein FRC04_001424 [Tulasnella sp. 424]KAG8972700.1 hypothetical protein FRC05_009621 [Tulasnella sp. 425]